MEREVKLRKHLGLLDVFSIAAGAMISSGLFILPALACREAGPSAILAYIIAALLVLPGLLSKAELATAMPRAGGTYFYVERSMGGLWGLFCGLANWFSLAMKSAFAIIGIALFASFLTETFIGDPLGEWTQKLVAAVCCLLFGGLNIISVKETSRFQNILVGFLLAALSVFVVAGIPAISHLRYGPFSPHGTLKIFATAGMVFVSYGGLTNIASIAEEIHHPSKNLPLGMLAAWFIVSFLYVMVVFIAVGVLEMDVLAASEAPISAAADIFLGKFGFVLLSLAAMAAYVTTANGGILSASRSPLAMSRDHLLPASLTHISGRFHTPLRSILLTCGVMVVAILFLRLDLLVKTASTLMILLFLLDNASVIIMRESKLQGYRPRFKAPLYPYMQIVTILLYVLLLIDMGAIPLLISAAFFVFSAVWYRLFAAGRIKRDSAVMHLVERVTDRGIKTPTLENELRDILLERDNIIADRFDHLLSDCTIFDLKGKQTAREVFEQAAAVLSESVGVDKQVLVDKLTAREAEGSTVLEPGLAIPHVIIEGKNKFAILPVRAADGIDFSHAKDPVKTVFFLAGTKDERNYHLRALMAIAQIVQEKDFYTRWFAARDTDALRNLLLLSKRKRDTVK